MQGAALSVLTIQLLLWSGIKITLSEVLKKTSPCSCMYNGGYYNLRSLASENGPKLVAMTDNGYKYGYNPCTPFTLGGACKNVAVCRWADSDLQPYVALGRQDNVTCLPSLGDGIEISVKLIFHQPGKEQKGWITTIKMKCNRTLNKPKFTIINDTAAPVLQVEHKCCCSDACPDQLLIEILLVGAFLALVVVVVGIYYKKCINNDNNINDRQQQENRAGSGYELVDVGAGARRGGADARRGGDRTRRGGGGDDGVVARRGGDDSVGAKRGAGAGARRGGDGDGARHGGGGAGARCGGGARRGGGGNEEDDKANSMPYVTDDDLVLAVEEHDGERCSSAIPIPVTEGPEDQCCSDDNVQEEDDVAFRTASHPVEHEEA